MSQTNTAAAIALESQYSASNYHPIPVVLERGEGVFVYDVEGKRYYDFLSAYSAVSQGHCHPVIYQALVDQAKTLTLTSRAFHSDILGEFSAYITDYFGFDQVLPMNTGAEAVETAIKICRKWGYEKKGIPSNQARIVVCEGGFHGRTSTIISFSSDEAARKNFGPYAPGFEKVPYNDIKALETALADPNIAGFLVEPIQGEAGVKMPDDNYLQAAARLCKQYNVLLVADEIQTGIGRTGALLGVCGNCTCTNGCQRQSSYVQADMVLLGKALTGGFYPVSAVLANKNVMDVITPNTHGSTYGGNPLGCKVAIAALEVIKQEHLMERTRTLGQILRKRLGALADSNALLSGISGRGLLNALLINDSTSSDTAWQLCLALKDQGLLAKPTHGNIIRLAPPLVITEEQLNECCSIIENVFNNFSKTA